MTFYIYHLIIFKQNTLKTASQPHASIPSVSVILLLCQHVLVLVNFFMHCLHPVIYRVLQLPEQPIKSWANEYKRTLSWGSPCSLFDIPLSEDKIRPISPTEKSVRMILSEKQHLSVITVSRRAILCRTVFGHIWRTIDIQQHTEDGTNNLCHYSHVYCKDMQMKNIS